MKFIVIFAEDLEICEVHKDCVLLEEKEEFSIGDWQAIQDEVFVQVLYENEPYRACILQVVPYNFYRNLADLFSRLVFRCRSSKMITLILPLSSNFFEICGQKSGHL